MSLYPLRPSAAGKPACLPLPGQCENQKTGSTCSLPQPIPRLPPPKHLPAGIETRILSLSPELLSFSQAVSSSVPHAVPAPLDLTPSHCNRIAPVQSLLLQLSFRSNSALAFPLQPPCTRESFPTPR